MPLEDNKIHSTFEMFSALHLGSEFFNLVELMP